MNVTGAGGISVYDHQQGDGTLGTLVDLPSKAQTLSDDESFSVGFDFLRNPGQEGQQIAAYQDNTSYEVSDAPPTYYSILQGVGLTAGSAGSNSWGSPVLVANGYYQGSAGSLTVDANTDDITTVPATLPTPTPSGVGYPAGTVASVDGAAGPSADGTNTINIS